jgi:hypothetical protein
MLDSAATQQRPSRSSKTSNAAGKKSRSAARSRSTARERSQIIVWCARATSLIASACGESPAIGR